MKRKNLFPVRLLLATLFILPACASDESDDGDDNDDFVDDDDVSSGEDDDSGEADDDTVGDGDDDSVSYPDPAIVWIPIESGEFLMGDDPGLIVTISAFEIMESEVTQRMYEAVMGSNPSYFKEPTYESCRECPVESVLWGQAREFCEAVGGRLPSSAEWEYAARAGTDSPYVCGDDSSCLPDVGWLALDSSCYLLGDDTNPRTHPVKQKNPNPWGLYDTLGNVWEWVQDCHHRNAEGQPTDGTAWETDCTLIVDLPSREVRGGSYCTNGLYYLTVFTVEGSSETDCSPEYGFRCVRD